MPSNAPLLFPMSHEEEQLLAEESDGDLEEGMVPHGRSKPIFRLGPPLCCCCLAFLMIVAGFGSIHHLKHLQESTIKEHVWELTALIAALMLAMLCMTLACVSFAFNVVPDDGELENYVITKAISEGAFGAVYKAIHLDKNGSRTPVALKFCKLGSEEELNSGISEAAYQSGEKHDNLVACHQMFLYKKGTSFFKMLLTKDTPYSLCIALDLCSGDVQGHIKKWATGQEQWPGYDTVLHIFKQTVSGVECLHKKGLIHRDLKPENLFVSVDKRYVKVGDLGLADQTSGQGSEEAEGECGTPGYIAPEVYRGEPYSTRADQWSLGCIIFDLVRPTAEGGWSLLDYISEQYESRDPQAVAEMMTEGDLWYGFGEKNRYAEVLGVAEQAEEIANNATVAKVFKSCIEPDQHRRCSSTALLQMLGGE